MTGSFGSVDELLSTDALGALVGHEILDVARSPMQTEGFSETPMERITCTLGDGAELRFVLKQFDPNNWLVKLTADTGLREISLLERGWYSQLPELCSAPAVAATRDGNGGSLLMWDISTSLFPEGDSPITLDDLDACVGAITSLHAHHWGDAAFSSSDRVLCSLNDWIHLLSPDIGKNRVGLGVDNDVTAALEGGWSVFSDTASNLAAETVSMIHSDPGKLLQAFEPSPRTMIHGDVKLANLGVDPATGHVIMFDWGLISHAPPLVELGWFLAVNSARLPVSKETVIDTYRERLASRGIDLGSTWDRDLDLGLLAGGTLRLGWAKAYGTLSEDEAVRTSESAEIDWWSEVTERASRWMA